MSRATLARHTNYIDRFPPCQTQNTKLVKKILFHAHKGLTAVYTPRSVIENPLSDIDIGVRGCKWGSGDNTARSQATHSDATTHARGWAVGWASMGSRHRHGQLAG